MLKFNIFDFHIHCGYAHNTYYSPNELKSFVLVTPEMKGCLCSSLSGIFDYRIGEEDLRQICQTTSIIGAYWVNPYLPQWQDNVVRLCKENQIPCIKLSPTANIYEPTYEMLEPVWQFCQKQHKFIVIHTDEYRSNPVKLIPLLEKFPKVPVVLYHLNTGLENIHIAKLFPQVYLETSFGEKIMDCMGIKMALDVIGENRLLFGTDFPIGWKSINKAYVSHYYKQLIQIYLTHICKGNRAQAQKILYYNAQQLLSKYHIKI
ncbi:MAG: amidohydrolase family protein [Candidatus Avelusimicrobium sp.]|uniref:amidohydrolase family protein n=1 Tax=Candidatus Avelusimicrobium sp. TaxID=3048833 RepID=UPI003F0D7BFF